MKLLVILIVIVTISFSKCQVSAEKSVKKAFIDEEIVPDVLKSVDDVKNLKVTYPSGVKVDLGNVLTPTNVKDQPKVEWEAEPDAFYTLLMTGKYNYIINFHRIN
jgi:hypothetical protein